MKLSLSGRIAERFNQQNAVSLSFHEFIHLARRVGYEAVCMRASLASIDTTTSTILDMKRQLDSLGLRVSMVTGNYEIPHNDERGPDALRHIAPHLDLAERFGSRLVRICIKKADDIVWTQKACDEARERGIDLVHQCHPASLFETVEGILSALGQINRPNFGLIYEAASLYNCGDPAPHLAIPRLASHIRDVYVQNCRVHPSGKTVLETYTRGKVRTDWIPLTQRGDIRFPEVFNRLREAGYDGYVTVHQAFGDLMPPEVAAKEALDFLRPLIRGTNPHK